MHFEQGSSNLDSYCLSDGRAGWQGVSIRPMSIPSGDGWDFRSPAWFPHQAGLHSSGRPGYPSGDGPYLLRDDVMLDAARQGPGFLVAALHRMPSSGDGHGMGVGAVIAVGNYSPVSALH